MKRRDFLAGMTAAAAWSGLAQASPKARGGYEYYEIGDVSAPRPGPTSAGLMLHGGGDWALEAFRWLIQQSGGGRIVVLRASYGGENGEEIYRDIGGVTAVQTLVFSHRRAASDPRVLDIVRGADGLFMGGGDQSKYVRFWKGTPLNALIDAHVRAGRPIGGTSAGLAVIGAHSYGAMDGGSVTSAQAMANPMGPKNTLVSDFLHFHHMERVITDSHFNERERQGRLLAWLARLAKETGDTAITGIGVDEQTALCVDAKGIGRVMTNTAGKAWLIRPMKQAEVAFRGKPLTYRRVPVQVLGPKARLDLNDFSVDGPVDRITADVLRGKLTLLPA